VPKARIGRGHTASLGLRLCAVWLGRSRLPALLTLSLLGGA